MEVLIALATLIAGSAALVFGKLVQPPPTRQDAGRRSGWSAPSMAAGFAAAFGAAALYLTDLLEEHSTLLLAVAVLGPLAAAAWEQRIREIRPYRPDPLSALRRLEVRDRPDPDVPETDPVAMVLQH